MSAEDRSRREELDARIGEVRDDLDDLRDTAFDLQGRGALPQVVHRLIYFSSETLGAAHDELARDRHEGGE